MLLLTLVATGCGSSLFYERSIAAGGRGHAAATVRVEPSEHIEGSRVVVVEQEAGQGFVLEAGAHASAGFEFEGGNHGTVPDTVADNRTGPWNGAAVSTEPSGGVAADSERSIAGRSESGMNPGGSAEADRGVGGDSVRMHGGGAGSPRDRASLDVETAAMIPRDGVWGLDGRPTALTALMGPGVQVDGIRVHLDQLEALAELRLPEGGESRLATDGALEAWAELAHDALPRAGGETHVVVGLRATNVLAVPRAPIRVHLVIDRSSSMQRDWARVLASARALIRQLRAEDELHIVAYGTDAVEAWRLGPVGDGSDAIRALEEIAVGGGTNIEAGLRLAYGAAARTNEMRRSLVILLSDGVPTHGEFDAAELGRLASEARRVAATTTSVIGLGTEFDARTLRRIARDGRGSYHVSTSIEELAGGLTAELEAHSRAAARRLSLQVQVGEGVELLGIADGESGAERIDGGVEFSTPSLDAGEERRLVLRVRVPGGRSAQPVGRVDLAYQSAVTNRTVRATKELLVSAGDRAIAREGAAGAAILGASLAAALDEAAAAVLAGDAGAATGALTAHAELAEGRVEHRHSERLRTRVRVVRRLARAIGELLPHASHSQRRQVSLALGGAAVRLGR